MEEESARYQARPLIRLYDEPEEDEVHLRRRHVRRHANHNKDNDYGIRFVQCGGGRMVVRRQKRRD